MAKKGFQEEGLRLIFELIGRKQAEQFNKLAEDTARKSEETAKRVGQAGRQMGEQWNEGLQRFVKGGRITRGMGTFIEELQEQFVMPPGTLASSIEQQFAELEGAMPRMPGFYGEYVDATEDAFGEAEDAAADHAQSLGDVANRVNFLYLKLAGAAYAYGRAVVQAWQMAEEAAQSRAMREALISMGNYFDVQSGRIVADLIEISDQTLSTAQAIRVANQALIAGAQPFGESVPRLFEIARASAVATGQDVNWVFDTLIRGIARAEPRLIDNANIYLSVTQAAREMAEAEGVVYDELDRQEKMVYTLNAVLQEGQTLIEAVSDEALAAQQPFQRLRGEVDNLRQAFLAGVTAGDELGEELRDLADEIENTSRIAIQLVAVGRGITAVFNEVSNSLYLVRLGLAVANGDAKLTRESLDELNQAFRRMEEAEDLRGVLSELFPVTPIKTFQEAYEEALGESQEALGEFSRGQEAFEFPTFGIGFEGLQEAQAEAGELSDEARRLFETLDRLEEDAYRDRLEAGQDFADDMRDLERDLADERRDIWQDYVDEIADINRDYRQRLEDVDQETRDREREAIDDYHDELEDEQRDHAMRLVRIERDYQEDVLRINEDYQMELWDAIGERDATRALRARRRRNLELRRARRERDREVKEENEDYAATLDDLKENYDERRQAAKEYRRDELAEIETWHRRRLEEARINRDRDLRDMQQSHDDELEELKDSHAEQLEEIAARYRHERILAEIEYEYRESALDRHLARMAEIRRHYGGGPAPEAAEEPAEVRKYGPSPQVQSVALELEGASFEMYEEDIAAFEEQLAELTESSEDEYDTQFEVFNESLDERENASTDYYDDAEDDQSDHHRDSLRLLHRYLSSDSRMSSRHRQDQLYSQRDWQRTYIDYDRAYYRTAQTYYDYHLTALERMLSIYNQRRQVAISLQYWWEEQEASEHYRTAEEMYEAHLRQLWLIYNLFGTPPAPTPGVPEVVGKYATEKNVAVQHYRDVEKLYERHLQNLWAIYENQGVPGSAGGNGNQMTATAGRAVANRTRTVAQPPTATQTVDLSGLNLNHQVQVAIQNQLAGIDGRVTNAIHRAMREVL